MINRFIISVVFLLVSLALVVGLIWPKYQDFQDLQAKIKEKDFELQSKTEYFAKVKEVSTRLEEYQEEISKISSALPAQPTLPSLYRLLKQTASETGLILEDINSVVAKTDEMREINVSLRVAGSYSAFKDFLSALEKSARLIEVQSIAFFTPNDLEKPFTFDIHIKTQSY